MITKKFMTFTVYKNWRSFFIIFMVPAYISNFYYSDLKQKIFVLRLLLLKLLSKDVADPIGSSPHLGSPLKSLLFVQARIIPNIYWLMNSWSHSFNLISKLLLNIVFLAWRAVTMNTSLRAHTMSWLSALLRESLFQTAPDARGTRHILGRSSF